MANEMVVSAQQTVVVVGAEGKHPALTAASQSRHFTVTQGRLELFNVKLTGGYLEHSGFNGGSVFLEDSGVLTATKCTFFDKPVVLSELVFIASSV